MLSANADMLIGVFNLHQLRIGIFLQFLAQGSHGGEPWTRLCDRAVEMAAGDYMHGHGHDGRRHPDMNVPAICMIFVDAHYAFVEGVSAR